jgi:hypothetical protein
MFTVDQLLCLLFMNVNKIENDGRCRLNYNLTNSNNNNNKADLFKNFQLN